MSLSEAAREWIVTAWRENGSAFNANDLPVAQFPPFDIDDLAHPFKNQPLSTWRLVNGFLLADSMVKLERVPYIAFALNEAKLEMGIQVQWASRCGYGYTIRFSPFGEVIEQKMQWVS